MKAKLKENMTRLDFTAKGFLERSPSGCGRLTKEHVRVLELGVKSVIERAIDQRHVPKDLATVVSRIVNESLASYPRDRSCHTCDFANKNAGGIFCYHWQDDVPENATEQGCDQHAATGIPF